MNQSFRSLFVLFLAAALLLSACGSSARNSSETADVVTSVSSEELPPAEGSVTPEGGIVPADQVPGDDEELPEYLQGDPIDQIAAGQMIDPGEGVAALAGETLHLKETAVRKEIGESLTVKTAYGSYELTVDDIALTDKRNPEDEEAVPFVLSLQYHYKNIDYGEEFLLGDVSFKAVNENEILLAPYAFRDINDGTQDNPRPVAPGEVNTVELGYRLKERPALVRVIFDELTAEDGEEFYWDVSLKE